MRVRRRVLPRAEKTRAEKKCAIPVVVALIALAGCDRPPSPASGNPPSIPAPAAATTASASATPAATTAPIPAAIEPARALHEIAQALPADCLAHAAAPKPAAATTVHRWVDSGGVVHYSDQAPPAGARDYRVLDVPGAPPIQVRASGYDTDLPEHVQQRAVADALGVQRAMHDALGVAATPGLALHIVFVKSADAYARLIEEPALAQSAGAYSTARRTIFVRMQAQEEANFAILRHEITHALIHESVGYLSTPVNEGLAEYFGRYRLAGLGGQVDVRVDRRALAGAADTGDGSAALVDLLAREGRDFYLAGDADRERMYLRAYALIALLMHSAEGRAALAAAIAAQHADPCRPLPAESVLDRRYPGGLAALAAAWTAFMRDPPDTVQAY